MKFLFLISSVFLVGALAFADSLTINANPNQPVIIPTGTSITIHGHTLHPPLFVVENIEINWQSQLDLTVYAITLHSLDTNLPPYDRILTGDALNELFPNSSHGVVVLRPGHYLSGDFGCGNMPIPSPIPTNFNIPVEVKIYGQSSAKSHARVTATTIIHLQ